MQNGKYFCALVNMKFNTERLRKTFFLQASRILTLNPLHCEHIVTYESFAPPEHLHIHTPVLYICNSTGMKRCIYAEPLMSQKVLFFYPVYTRSFTINSYASLTATDAHSQLIMERTQIIMTGMLSQASHINGWFC